MTSKGKIGKTYQTPYGDVRIERHVYQGGLARISHEYENFINFWAKFEINADNINNQISHH